VRRREFITLLGSSAVWPVAARAQQPGKVARVGFLGNSTAALEANLVKPFRDGLRELGYEEGRDTVKGCLAKGRLPWHGVEDHVSASEKTTMRVMEI
jgi:hypothetical protein